MKRRVAHAMVLVNADRKRMTVLAVLVLCLTAAGVRAFVLSGPRSAHAATTAEKSTASNKASGAAAENSSRETAVARRPDIKAPLPPELTRDLFSLDEVYFPRPAQTEPTAVVPPKSEPANDETSAQRDAAVERGRVEARVAEAIKKLRLKSTMLGGSPMAVIEVGNPKDKRGVVVRPGQEVEGFTLVEITTSGVVLEMEGVRVDLKRALPEG